MKRFFESPKAMALAAIVATVCGIACGVLFYFIGNCTPDVQQPIYIFQGLVAMFLFVAYRDHDKNVMKGLLGSLLTILLLNEACYIFGFFSVKVSLMAGGTQIAFIAIEVLYTVLQVALFVNHFLINGEHHSSPRKVRCNQVLLVLLALVVLVQEIFSICTLGSYTPLALAGQILWFLLEIGSYGVVVCIESKLDAYRLAKESK